MAESLLRTYDSSEDFEELLARKMNEKWNK